jgi:hypothetical protein
MARVSELVGAAQRDGAQDVVFIAMVDSHLAMEAATQGSRGIRFYFSTVSIPRYSRYQIRCTWPSRWATSTRSSRATSLWTACT